MKSGQSLKLAECESDNHEICYEYDNDEVILWQCERCNKKLCYADGAGDKNHHLCDSCVAQLEFYPTLIKRWLQRPPVKEAWLAEAARLLEDATADPVFAAWYAYELYEGHLGHDRHIRFESVSDVVRTDMSYWGDA